MVSSDEALSEVLTCKATHTHTHAHSYCHTVKMHEATCRRAFTYSSNVSQTLAQQLMRCSKLGLHATAYRLSICWSMHGGWSGSC